MRRQSFVRVVALVAAIAWGMEMRTAWSAERAETNRMVQLSFTARNPHADPFNDLEMDVVFTTPDGSKVRVPAFWAGDKTWRVRYASSQAGVHRFRSECSDSADKGLHGIAGEVEVVAYKGDNPLYRHGPLRVASDHRHFEHRDGTPFLWLADTWWMGLCERLKWPDEFKTLAADRREKGFNVIQIVAGLYPDMPAFDPRGRNEAGFPWERDYQRIRPEYFDRADQRLLYLVDQGITPCLVGAWGYHLPWMGVERMKKHWRYLIARYGALPVVWCVAGEINLPYYLEKGFPKGGEKQTASWEEVIRYVRKVDGFGRLVTAHPTGIPPLSARLLYKDQSLFDFDMLQTGHGGREVLAPSLRALAASYQAKPAMPVLNAEVSYEALLDRIPAHIPRRMVWTSLLSGAAGHTYGANGIWQLNRRGQPYGKSPHGGNYGTIPWDEAMKLPGSGQTGLAKRLLERYPWHRFTPHPEWAAWAEGGSRAFTWGEWIWFPEGNPAKDAPAEARFFRKSFELPDEQVISWALLRLTVDDRFTVYLNGHLLGSHSNWMTGREFTDIAKFLRPGRNVLAVHGENLPAPKGQNPAGLSCNLEIAPAKGKKIVVHSDATWRCAAKGVKGWQEREFEDRDWVQARVVAHFGEGPWGRTVELRDDFLVPYASGIPGAVRIVYLPRALPVALSGLESDKHYIVSIFDVITGRTTELGPARPDAHGVWTVSPPRDLTADWVLVLDARAAKP